MKLHCRAPQWCSRGSSSVWLQCGVTLQCGAPVLHTVGLLCGVMEFLCDVPIWSSGVGWALLWTPTTDSTVDSTVDPTVGQDFIV